MWRYHKHLQCIHVFGNPLPITDCTQTYAHVTYHNTCTMYMYMYLNELWVSIGGPHKHHTVVWVWGAEHPPSTSNFSPETTGIPDSTSCSPPGLLSTKGIRRRPLPSSPSRKWEPSIWPRQLIIDSYKYSEMLNEYIVEWETLILKSYPQKWMCHGAKPSVQFNETEWNSFVCIVQWGPFWCVYEVIKLPMREPVDKHNTYSVHYTYQCDQLTLLYPSVPLLVYFNKLQNSSEIAINFVVQTLYGASRQRTYTHTEYYNPRAHARQALTTYVALS